MPDTAWYDSTGGLAQAMLNQVEYPFETDRRHRERREPRARGRLRRPSPATSSRASPRRIAQWSDDWTAAFQNDGFATMAVPGLDARRHRGQRRGRRGLGHRQRLPRRRRQLGRLLPDGPGPGRAPGGGQGVRRLAHRPRAAGQGFRGQWAPSPARSRPRTLAEVTGAANAFFNDAPTGEILADRAAAITVQPFKGPKYSDILSGVPGLRSSASTTARRTPTSHGTTS